MACLNPHITDLECLNEDDANTVQNLFQNNGAVLKSDTDQQLLIKLQFRQPVKISGKLKKAKTFSNLLGTFSCAIQLFMLSFRLGPGLSRGRRSFFENVYQKSPSSEVTSSIFLEHLRSSISRRERADRSFGDQGVHQQRQPRFRSGRGHAGHAGPLSRAQGM